MQICVPRGDGWAELYDPESRQPLGWTFFVDESEDADENIVVYKYVGEQPTQEYRTGMCYCLDPDLMNAGEMWPYVEGSMVQSLIDGGFTFRPGGVPQPGWSPAQPQRSPVAEQSTGQSTEQSHDSPTTLQVKVPAQISAANLVVGTDELQLAQQRTDVTPTCEKKRAYSRTPGKSSARKMKDVTTSFIDKLSAQLRQCIKWIDSVLRTNFAAEYDRCAHNVNIKRLATKTWGVQVS